MTNYEVMFIIDAALEDEKKDATVETVQSIIASDGEVEKVDVSDNVIRHIIINNDAQ